MPEDSEIEDELPPLPPDPPIDWAMMPGAISPEVVSAWDNVTDTVPACPPPPPPPPISSPNWEPTEAETLDAAE